MDIYSVLDFPPAPNDRPYVYINMVASIDGKTATGSRDEDVSGLGTRVDHVLMTRIEASADAVIVGGRTLRATSRNWNPRARKRIAVSHSGNLPHDACFFTGGDSFIATDNPGVQPFGTTKVIGFGSGGADLPTLLRLLRTEQAIERLVVMGGSELNAQFLQKDLVDELFLTIAPRIKLGRDIPTYAGGEPLPRDQMTQFGLFEHHVVGDEVFLRYRRKKR